MWTIRQDQMNAFAAAAFEGVLGRVSAGIATVYPEVPRALGEGYVPWVRDLLESAVALEITREENLLRFVEWHAMVGVRSSVAEVFPWAFDMLRVTTEHEDDRVEAVELRMQGLDGEEG